MFCSQNTYALSCCRKFPLGKSLCFAFLIMPLLSISACQQSAGTPDLNKDNTMLQKEITDREVELMQLRLQLLQQKEEISRLSSSQSQAVQEVVRAKARLRSHAGKAEAVANMAEVRMMLQSSQKRGSTVTRKQSLKRAEQYLTMADSEFDEENYEGAAYLVGKARELIRPTGSASDVIPSATTVAEANFFTPIRMRVLSRSNVREKASLQARILFHVDASTQVQAIAYKGSWLKIQTGNKTGWIYYKLVDLDR
jgi:hypothetical protein